MAEKLTAKQALFVQEYLVDLNASKAALRAGYSPKTAYSMGHELLKKPEIKASVASAIAARTQRTQIDADWVLQRLAQEVEADLADLYHESGELKPTQDWPDIWRKGLVTGIEVLEEADGKKATVRKVRLSDRIRRLELIGKHVAVGAFRERHELAGPDGGPIVIDEIARAARVEALLERARARRNDQQ